MKNFDPPDAHFNKRILFLTNKSLLNFPLILCYNKLVNNIAE